MSTTNLMPTASSTNRYSLFDGLDDIATTSPDLTLGPPSFSSRHLDDETLRRLSASLNSLASQKHGLNHLPELPVPTYDNGNIDLDVVLPRARQSPVLAQQIDLRTDSRPIAVIYEPHARPSLSRRVSDISSELDDPIDTRSFSQSSHLLAHIDSPVRPRYGSVRNTSTSKSRPVSMYSTSTARRVRCEPRPDTAGSQADRARQHKKAISYSEQRYSPTRQHESACPKDPMFQQDSSKVQSRTRFRFMPSLKNLHAQAKSHAKRLTVEEKPTVDEKPESDSTQVMDIHSALRLKGLSPLHDPNDDQDFARECQELLDSRPDSSQRQTRKVSARGPGADTDSIDPLGDDEYHPIFRHISTVSETATVDTDILNSDWPQPPNTYPPMPLERGHPPTGPSRIIATEPTSQQHEDRKYDMAPSPPPTYPLPAVPQVAGTPSKQPSQRSLVNPMTSANIGLSFRKYNLPNTKSACSKTNNRFKALATNRGLSVDACLNNDASSDCEMAGDGTTDPLPSPLNARFNQSSRNSKVRELKKRHLSLLHRDIPTSMHNGDKVQERAGPGQGFSKVPTSIFSATKTDEPKKSIHFDQRKPLPQLPGPARYRRSSEASASVTKANIGKSRHARSASAWSRQSSRQVGELDQDGSLALSEVMIMVDSSPRQSRDFRAGAIRVSRPPRRKSSINKGQTLPPLRYQSTQRRSLHPRRSSSLMGRDRSNTDTLSVIISAETGVQQNHNDLMTTFVGCQINSGTVSPSKASSVLEPSPVFAQDTEQYKVSSQRSPTPVRYVKNRQYIPSKDTSASASPSVERMKSQRKSKSRPQPTPTTVACTTKSTNEVLAHIEADFVKPSLPTESSSPLLSRRTATLHPRGRYDDSDVSITPKSSFQSTCSESSNNQARKNSDASMTDPNEYDGANYSAKDSSRVVLLPTPPRQRAVDTTLIKSKKRYSNMPPRATRGKTYYEEVTARETPYTFQKHDKSNVTPPKQVIPGPSTANDFNTADSEIRINHFLTEADQMDNAIDSFAQSTSSSSNGSCRSRTRLPVPVTTSPSNVTSGIASQRQMQLRSIVSATKEQQRYSAMSNISNIVDLQRIQDQINGVGNGDHAAGMERSAYGHGMCREMEGFGRISLVARPSTT